MAISLLFLYVDNVRTSEETPLLSSTVCYEDSVYFLYVDDIRIPQEVYIESQRPVTGIALLYFIFTYNCFWG
jgi:hypothetical protein